MTPKQIERLNVKIAKKLGWKDLKLENTPFGTRRTIGIAPGNQRHQFVPNYFSNLAYAMKLVDWAVEHGYDFSLEKETTDYWAAHFYERQLPISEIATLPSVAICMAFLKIK